MINNEENNIINDSVLFYSNSNVVSNETSEMKTSVNIINQRNEMKKERT